MLRQKLMLGAAFASLSLLPLTSTTALASSEHEYSLNIENSWDNSVEVSLETTINVFKDLNIIGNISIDGHVQVDALSMATLDDKQVIDSSSVQFEDYQNAYSGHSTVGAEPGLGQTSTSQYFTEEGLPHPATYTNTASVGTFTLGNATGNIGLNIAAGDYNLQENAAVLSSAEGLISAKTITTTSSSAEGSADVTTTTTVTVSGTVTSSNVTTTAFTSTSTESATDTKTNTAYLAGGAEASSYSLQNLYNTEFNSETYDVQNTVITNTATIGTGSVLNGASGNIGVNVAAGAFNIQKNALVIASVRGGNLAEATAGTLQNNHENETVNETVTNIATLSGSLAGASGNIGVNIAAGVGNMQLNSLTIANALLPTTTTTTGGTPASTQ